MITQTLEGDDATLLVAQLFDHYSDAIFAYLYRLLDSRDSGGTGPGNLPARVNARRSSPRPPTRAPGCTAWRPTSRSARSAAADALPGCRGAWPTNCTFRRGPDGGRARDGDAVASALGALPPATARRCCCTSTTGSACWRSPMPWASARGSSRSRLRRAPGDVPESLRSPHRRGERRTIMTRHAEYEKLVAVYDKLGEAERQAVDRHLAECPACATDLAAYRQMDTEIRSLGRLKAGAGVRVRFSQMIREQAQSAAAATRLAHSREAPRHVSRRSRPKPVRRPWTPARLLFPPEHSWSSWPRSGWASASPTGRGNRLRSRRPQLR